MIEWVFGEHWSDRVQVSWTRSVGVEMRNVFGDHYSGMAWWHLRQPPSLTLRFPQHSLGKLPACSLSPVPVYNLQFFCTVLETFLTPRYEKLLGIKTIFLLHILPLSPRSHQCRIHLLHIEFRRSFSYTCPDPRNTWWTELLLLGAWGCGGRKGREEVL